MDGSIRRYGVALCIWALVAVGLTPINAVDIGEKRYFDTIVCKNILVRDSNGTIRIVLGVTEDGSHITLTDENQNRLIDLTCGEETTTIAIKTEETHSVRDATRLMMGDNGDPKATIGNEDGTGRVYLYNALGRYTILE